MKFQSRASCARRWQRKPLLVRAALPDFTPPVDRERLLHSPAHRTAEVRLIERSGSKWTVSQGPFRRLPSRRRPGWTILVQGVDLLDDRAHTLLQQFRFVPDARLDDLMISYATDGGGVGPHIDSYDVFLLQAYGRRRWRISRQTRPAARERRTAARPAPISGRARNSFSSRATCSTCRRAWRTREPPSASA